MANKAVQHKKPYGIIYKAIYALCVIMLVYTYYIFLKQGCKWQDNISDIKAGAAMLALIVPMIVLPVTLFIQTVETIKKWISNLSFSKRYPDRLHAMLFYSSKFLAVFYCLISLITFTMMVPYLIKSISTVC